MSFNFRFITTSLVFVTCLLFATAASADIVFVLTQGFGGGVDVVGTGSGNSTAATVSSDFDSQDYNTDFLADTFGTGITPANSVIGTLTNITTGISESITGFRVDRDPDSADDIDFQTANAMTFAIGDAFSMTLNASFDFATLPFAQLVPGTHTEDGGEFADENFGQYTVNVAIPEPGSVAFLTIVVIGMGIRRRSN